MSKDLPGLLIDLGFIESSKIEDIRLARSSESFDEYLKRYILAEEIITEQDIDLLMSIVEDLNTNHISMRNRAHIKLIRLRSTITDRKRKELKEVQKRVQTKAKKVESDIRLKLIAQNPCFNIE